MFKKQLTSRNKLEKVVFFIRRMQHVNQKCSGHGFGTWKAIYSPTGDHGDEIGGRPGMLGPRIGNVASRSRAYGRPRREIGERPRMLGPRIWNPAEHLPIRKKSYKELYNVTVV